MDSLPLNLLDEVLFRLDPKSLAIMRCTNRSIKSHISDDPYFKSEYSSRIGSSLLHISRDGSPLVCFHPFGDSRLFLHKVHLERLCHILGYSSGLLLLFVDDCFCVANPLTKKFRFLVNSESRPKDCVAFAVDQIDRSTQRFKIVCITESTVPDRHKTTYRFQIHAEDSWRLSQTKLTCVSSKLRTDTKPVYFHGALYWLRTDGSIVTFNPVKEQARLIPIEFDWQVGAKFLFHADENRLTLISATEEVIYVYALESILTDPKCILVRQFGNEPVQRNTPLYWNVEAFDGRCLVMRAMENLTSEPVIYGYDMRANKWEVVGLVPGWCDGIRNFYQLKPSWSSVIGLVDQINGPKPNYISFATSRRISSVEGLIGLINRNLRI